MRLRTVAPAATIVLAALGLLSGCKKGDSNANGGANTRNTTITSNTTTTTLPQTVGTPTSTASASTPTEALRLYYEALKRKDGPAVKALFSRATINMLEEQAKRSNKSFDDVFNEGLNDAGREIPDTLPESRNEKINGDRASLEVNDSKKGRWETLHFVKEGGWKVSFADEDRAGGGDDEAGGDDEDGNEGGGDHSGGH